MFVCHVVFVIQRLHLRDLDLSDLVYLDRSSYLRLPPPLPVPPVLRLLLSADDESVQKLVNVSKPKVVTELTSV